MHDAKSEITSSLSWLHAATCIAVSLNWPYCEARNEVLMEVIFGLQSRNSLNYSGNRDISYMKERCLLNAA